MNSSEFENMETRYGAAFVQDIRDQLAACEAREVQQAEIKQMEEVLFRFRERARAMVDHYRVWRYSYALEKDPVERIYKGYEGQFLRQQLRDAWKLYLTINHDYHALNQQVAKASSEPLAYIATLPRAT